MKEDKKKQDDKPKSKKKRKNKYDIHVQTDLSFEEVLTMAVGGKVKSKQRGQNS